MRAKTKLVTRAAPWRFKQAANSLTVCPLVITSSMTRICLFFSAPDELGMINAPRKLFFLLLNARLLCAWVWRILTAREECKGSCRCFANGLAISKDWLKPRSLSRCADKGIGMSSDTQKKIFDRFYRATTGNLHDVKGFGLGLSYVKAIIEKHGGSIFVESALGIGSTFTCFFPYKQLEN